MKRYKATIAYDGTNFSGFQIQPKERTVQGEVEAVLRKINKDTFIRVHPSGRTDAGAHAAAMVFHFDYSATIPKKGLFQAMNTLLPFDISVIELEHVAKDFHARYHAKAKTYTYRVHNQKIRNPFNRNFVYQHPYPMDLKRTQAALNVLIGTHDYTSFCSTRADKTDKVRTIYDIKIRQNKDLNEWVFTFHGDGFLYNMIRIIMGSVIPIADGRWKISKMQDILNAKNRKAAGMTLTARGLCLQEVHY